MGFLSCKCKDCVPFVFVCCVFDDNNKEVLHFALARNFKFVSIVVVIFQTHQKELGDKFNPRKFPSKTNTKNEVSIKKFLSK